MGHKAQAIKEKLERQLHQSTCFSKDTAGERRKKKKKPKTEGGGKLSHRQEDSICSTGIQNIKELNNFKNAMLKVDKRPKRVPGWLRWLSDCLWLKS